LAINVPSDGDYFVLLVDANSHELIESFFIQSGGAITDASAPLGTYLITYAKGRSWCGADQLFGPNTETAEPADPLTFTDDGNSYGGKTVSLIPQLNGNLNTKSIPRSQFWHG
jgi:hypothetical protein